MRLTPPAPFGQNGGGQQTTCPVALDEKRPPECPRDVVANPGTPSSEQRTTAGRNRSCQQRARSGLRGGGSGEFAVLCQGRLGSATAGPMQAEADSKILHHPVLTDWHVPPRSGLCLCLGGPGDGAGEVQITCLRCREPRSKAQSTEICYPIWRIGASLAKHFSVTRAGYTIRPVGLRPSTATPYRPMHIDHAGSRQCQGGSNCGAPVRGRFACQGTLPVAARARASAPCRRPVWL